MTAKIGVIGVGGMGERHVLNVSRNIAGADIVAVTDLNVKRAKEVARLCSDARVFTDPNELIHDPGVEAIIIASPDATHAGLTLECLQANKPVLCEKPLATNAADAKMIVDSEIAHGQRLISVGFMRRFDPQHENVNHVVDSGVIGEPILFKGVHRNAAAARDYQSHMGVSNSAVHDFDSARWLLNQEVETVYASGLRTHPHLADNAFDMLVFQLGLSGGTLAMIEVYVNATYGYEVSAEVVATQGAATTAQPSGAITRTSNMMSSAIAEDWLVRFQEAYLRELSHWITSLQGAPFQGASAWDGYASLVIADACLQSLHTGRPKALAPMNKPSLYT